MRCIMAGQAGVEEMQCYTYTKEITGDNYTEPLRIPNQFTIEGELRLYGHVPLYNYGGKMSGTFENTVYSGDEMPGSATLTISESAQYITVSAPYGFMHGNTVRVLLLKTRNS